jgi:hypothetical protein
MDLAQMVVHFASDFSVAMWRFLWVLGVVVGILYVGNSLLGVLRRNPRKFRHSTL